LLADYGITDPQAIAEIQRRIKAGEPIDKVLTDIADKYGQNSKLAQLFGKLFDKNNQNTKLNNSNNIPTLGNTNTNTNTASADVPVIPNNPNAYTDLDAEARKELRATTRQRKMQIFEQALTAKSKVDFDAPTIGSVSLGSSDDNSVVMQSNNADDELARVQSQIKQQNIDMQKTNQSLKQAQQMQEDLDNGLNADDFMPISNNDDVENNRADSVKANLSSENAHQFKVVSASNQAQPSRWDLGNTLQTPASKYTVLAGWVIPATLISGINSDLPGQIIAQVSQSVYDSATGRYLLIPQGSRLVGQFAGGVLFGQERVLIAWQRIIFPDGRNLDIGEMAGTDSAGTDSAGYSGFQDKNFGKIFLLIYARN